MIGAAMRDKYTDCRTLPSCARSDSISSRSDGHWPSSEALQAVRIADCSRSLAISSVLSCNDPIDDLLQHIRLPRLSASIPEQTLL